MVRDSNLDRPSPLASKWSLAPDASANLGDVDFTLTEQMYKFWRFYYDLSNVTKEDIEVCKNVMALCRLIVGRVSKFLTRKEHDTIMDLMASTHKDFMAFLENRVEMSAELLEKIATLVDRIYPHWITSGMYWYAQSSAKGHKGAF